MRLDFNFSGRDESGPAFVVVDLVVDEVLFTAMLAIVDARFRGENSLDPVKTLNVRVPLVLQFGPVKLVQCLSNILGFAKTISGGLAEVLGDIGSVPHDF